VVSRHPTAADGPAPFTAMAVDLRGGEGIDAAVTGVDAIIHCATTARRDVQAAQNLGGPQVRSTQDLARAYLRASGRHRLVLPVRLPGPVFGGYRQGGHLAPERAVGRITFEEFLAERLPASRSGTTATSRRQ
jgi:uncharacterized protein YbjT (DUF2867 family)